MFCVLMVWFDLLSSHCGKAVRAFFIVLLNAMKYTENNKLSLWQGSESFFIVLLNAMNIQKIIGEGHTSVTAVTLGIKICRKSNHLIAQLLSSCSNLNGTCRKYNCIRHSKRL